MRETREGQAATDHGADPTNPGDPTDVRAQALARIAVRPPYFGLGAMEHRGKGIVSALVPVAPPTAPERGPVEAAQVARHLAILGSCAAALSRDGDDPNHYLATSAHYARLAGGPNAIQGGVLEAEAVASWIDKRNARALVKLLTTDGRGLHLLDVSYSVIAPKMFLRFNPPLSAEVVTELATSGRANGSAANNGLVEKVVGRGPGSIVVDCGTIPVSACAGHFPDYPAAPVAIVMGRVCATAGRALAAQLDRDIEYRIEEGQVTANKLAVAGQRLTLEARYVEPVAGGHVLSGRALADGESIGEVSVMMSAFDRGGAALDEDLVDGRQPVC